MDIGYYKQNEPYFGEWYITRLLGKGGYGKVFEIERKDPFSKTTYKAAMKIITVPANTQELNAARLNGMDDVSLTSYFHSMVERFVNEFDLMYKLKGNSNIVGYEDHRVVKHADGIGWDIQIKMELLTPVTEFFSNAENLSRENIIKLGMDMCRALEVCQSHKIIHRDIKPSNIFVSDNGDFKLGDFGVSRIKETTGTNLTKTGTIGYMAPEVYLGKTYDFSADIYSLGIVMYRLLNNNRLPFFPPISQPITVDDEEFALKSRIRGDKMSAPANADDEITKIILKACAFEPENRYSSPSEMLAELEVLANSDNNKPERFSAKVNRIKDSKINSNPEITDFVSSTCDKLENFDFETTDMKPEVYSETLQPHYDSNATTKDIPGRSLPEPDLTPTSSKKKKVIIACVICAAIILVAITGLLVYNSSSLKNKSPEKEAEIIADILLAEDSTFNKTILNSTYDEMYLAFIDIDLDGVNELLINELNSKNNSSNNSMIKFNTSSVAKEKWMWFGLHVGDFDLVNVEMPSLFADGNGKHYYLFHNRDFISSTEESSIEKIVCNDTTLKGDVVIKSSKTQYNSGKIIQSFYYEGKEVSEKEYENAYDSLLSKDTNLNMKWKIINATEYKAMSDDQKRDALIELYLAFFYDIEGISNYATSKTTFSETSSTEIKQENLQSFTETTNSQLAEDVKIIEEEVSQQESASQNKVEPTIGMVIDGKYINEWADLNINIPDSYELIESKSNAIHLANTSKGYSGILFGVKNCDNKGVEAVVNSFISSALGNQSKTNIKNDYLKIGESSYFVCSFNYGNLLSSRHLICCAKEEDNHCILICIDDSSEERAEKIFNSMKEDL